MSEVHDVIALYAEAQANASSWSEVAEILNAKTVVQRHATPVTYVTIRRQFGDTSRKLVADTLRDSPIGDLRDAHSVLLNESGGLDLSTDDRQLLLDQVGAAARWPVEFTAGLKMLGVTRQSPAESYGLPPVTAEQCQIAWAKRRCEQQWIELRDTTLWPAVAQGRTETIAALRAIASQLEG